MLKPRVARGPVQLTNRSNFLQFYVGENLYCLGLQNLETIVDTPLAHWIQGGYIDRNPMCFPIIMAYLRGYPISDSFISQTCSLSGYRPDVFYKILYTDCFNYGVVGLIRVVEKFLLRHMPDLLNDKIVSVLVDSDPDCEELVMNMRSRVVDLISSAMEDIGMGDIELSDAESEVLTNMQNNMNSFNYDDLRTADRFLQDVVVMRKSEQKIRGILPQFLIWLTTLIYKWMGIDAGDDVGSKIRLFLRRHPQTISDVCNAVDRIGWRHAEPVIDYAMMTAVDASVK